MVRGFSLVLVTFVMIVMLVFGLLSVSSAGADYRLSQKAAKTQQLYYGLDSRGEALRMQCDGAAKAAFTATGGGQGYTAELQKRLKAVAAAEGLTARVQNGAVTVNGTLVSKENAAYQLTVALRCTAKGTKTAPAFATEQWKMSVSGTTITGGSLNVWNGK